MEKVTIWVVFQSNFNLTSHSFIVLQSTAYYKFYWFENKTTPLLNVSQKKLSFQTFPNIFKVQLQYRNYTLTFIRFVPITLKGINSYFLLFSLQRMASSRNGVIHIEIWHVQEVELSIWKIKSKWLIILPTIPIVLKCKDFRKCSISFRKLLRTSAWHSY